MQLLLQRARTLRGEADLLLYEEGLLDTIAVVGPTIVIGSYALDLMTWRDIDIHVQLPHERDIATFFDLGRVLATRFQATKMSFSNQFIRPDVPFDHGLYWGIRLLFANEIWKVDLWGFGEEAYYTASGDFEQLRRLLENADRMAILRIKDAVCRRPAYRQEILSVDIYEAVAKHGVRTVEGFDSWLQQRCSQKKAEN